MFSPTTVLVAGTTVDTVAPSVRGMQSAGHASSPTPPPYPHHLHLVPDKNLYKIH